jgi:hypothetical protein
MSSAAQQRVDEGRKKIKVVQDFLDDYQRVTGVVPKALKTAIDKYLFALSVGLDVAEAADRVSAEVEEIYRDSYKACKDASPDETDDYWVCVARVDRGWQKRNVSKVLYWDDNRSMVRQLWAKWKADLAKWLEAEAKNKLAPQK